MPACSRALGRYELVCRIGAGGMGVVYEASELESRQRGVLKLLYLGAGPGSRPLAAPRLVRQRYAPEGA